MKDKNLNEFEQYLRDHYDQLAESMQLYDDIGVDPDPEIACFIEDFLLEIETVLKWIAFYYIDNIL